MMILLAKQRVLVLLLAATPVAVLGGKTTGRKQHNTEQRERASLRAVDTPCSTVRCAQPAPCVCPDGVTEIGQWAQDTTKCCSVYETCPDTELPCDPANSCVNVQCLKGSPPCGCADGSTVSATYACCGVYPVCPNESEPCTQMSAITLAPPSVLCVMDVYTCSDGTDVFRDPNNNCEFPACPTTTQTQTTVAAATMVCPEDTKLCPDDSYVNRDPEHDCEFLCSDHEKAAEAAKCPPGEVATWGEASLGATMPYPTAWGLTESIHRDGEVAYGKKIKLTSYAVHPIVAGESILASSTGVLYVWKGTWLNGPDKNNGVTLFVECQDKAEKDCSIYDIAPTCATSETDPNY